MPPITEQQEIETRRRIAADLIDLGLSGNDTVLVRCAASAITAPTSSRPKALLDGIRQVLGSGGTIVALAFTPDFYPWQRKRAAKAPFHAHAVPETGAFPRMLLQDPGAVRSRHPTNSFVAVGPNANLVLEGHTEETTSFHPMKKLIEIGGKMALIGCVDSSPGFSTVHRVQEDLGLAGRTLLGGVRICAVQDEGAIRWFARRDNAGCSAGFWKFYAKYEQAGILHKGNVGGAFSMLIDAAAAYRVERPILEENPSAAFCDDPSCTSCGLRTYAPRRMAHFLLSLPRKTLGRVYRRPRRT